MTNMGQYADDPEVNEYWTSDEGKKQEMEYSLQDIEYYQNIYRGRKRKKK